MCLQHMDVERNAGVECAKQVARGAANLDDLRREGPGMRKGKIWLNDFCYFI